MPGIGELHNLYKGERCFILGNGPSLIHAPFDLLDREYTFAMNRIALIYRVTDWRQTFMVNTTTAMNTTRYEDMRADIIDAMSQSKEFNFIWNAFRDDAWAQNEKTVFINCVHADYLMRDADDGWFSDDAGDWVSKFGSSAFAAVQIAYYLGFSPIYTLGMDGYTHYELGRTDHNHFMGEYMGDQYELDYDEINTGMRKAQEISLVASKRLGFEIYDATEAPGYGALPKANIREVLSHV